MSTSRKIVLKLLHFILSMLNMVLLCFTLGTQIRRRKPLFDGNNKQQQILDRSQLGLNQRQASSSSSSSWLHSSRPQTLGNSLMATHCSHLSESRDCSINSCFSWKVEKKENCFPQSKEQKCGKGTRKLLYTCVDHNGVSYFFMPPM